jgi:hypothetical protein
MPGRHNAVALALMLCGCLSGCAASLQDVKVEKVQLCEKRHCATLGKELDTDAFLSKIYNFLSTRIDQDVRLAEVNPSTRQESSDSISYYTQGGPLPFYTSLSSVKFTDVSFLDREKKEISFKLRPWASFLGVPVICASGDGVIKVNSPQEVLLETSSLCTWVVNPVNWQLKLKLDLVDLDRAFFGGYYSVGHGGPTSVGKGSGYQVASFKESYAPIPASSAGGGVVAQKPATANVGGQPRVSRLTYTTEFRDSGADNVVDPGEKISLVVEVSNLGNFEAKDVAVVLGGSPELVAAFGGKLDLGGLAANEKRKVVFEGTAPSTLKSDAMELKVDIMESGVVTGELKTLRLASRPAGRLETVQVLSRLPRLQFSLELKDQNANRVLEAGEEVTLLAEVSNRGDGPAEDVSFKLSGSRSLVALFGANHPVGDLPVGSSKKVEMRGLLPQELSSESAELRVELAEKNGFVPHETRVLKVATKGKELKEVVEVISELSVDDIPPKVKGYEQKDDFAVLIGISSYRETVVPEVKYARRDAEVLAKYFEQLSGIPKSNIAVLTDAHATKSDIESYLDDWLPRRATPGSRIYFYYAGHGAPEPDGKGAYIVPYEGHPDFASKMIPLSRIYDALNRLKAKEVVVFLDSCFSGAKGRSVTQQGIRPLVLTNERQLAVRDKPVVIAASSGSEVTSDLENARHGLFTYYLLKGIRGEADTNGNNQVELGELFDFVNSNVSRTAARELNRSQTPMMLPNSSAGSSSLVISRTQ